MKQPAWVLQSASADQPGPEQLSQVLSTTALQSWRRMQPGWQAMDQGLHEQALRLLLQLPAHETDVFGFVELG